MIHPTAVVDPQVEIGPDVQIGAYVIVSGRVRLGRGAIVLPHSVLQGHLEVGANCRIGPAAYVGLDPQHRTMDFSVETRTVLGAETVVREGASVHRASRAGPEHATRLGRRCMVMGAAHVGHDCVVGDDVTLANGVLLGGHCQVGDRVFLGGGSVVHQYCQIGRLAIVAGNEALSRDVPPFAAMRYGGLKAYNAVGCRRAGLSPASLRAIRAVYYRLHTHRTVSAALAAVRDEVPLTPEVREILAFAVGARRGLQPSLRFSNAAAMVGTLAAADGEA